MHAAATKTYLVTGGCGFIGWHLCAALRARGDRVRILDDLSTGDARRASSEELIIAKAEDPEAVRAAMDGVAGCFHLAAIASVQQSNRDWLGTHRTNLGGSITIFDAARAVGIPVIYASSAAVYGTAEPPVPLGEDARTKPLTAYGADKLGSELHARVASIVHGVPTVGLRLFNVYGAGQDPSSPYSGVISIFARNLAEGKALTVFGDGRQLRDYVYVKDVVAFFLAAMEAASDQQGGPVAEIFNVCTGRGTELLELAAEMAAAANLAPPKIDFAPARTGDIVWSLGEPALARLKLGLEARWSLRDGLADMRG